MDKRLSWTRIAIAIAIDWRLLLAIVTVVVVLLLKWHNLPGGMQPSGSLSLANRQPAATHEPALNSATCNL